MFSKRTDLGQEPLSVGRAAERPTRPPAPAGDERRISRSVIQSDLVIQGAILARGELELHGLVEGDVVARSVLIGPSATILGDILGERVSISGAVRGQVSGHHVHLGAGAVYQGEIRRGMIAIDEGAQFDGTVRALDEQDKREIAQRLAAAAPTHSASQTLTPAPAAATLAAARRPGVHGA